MPAHSVPEPTPQITNAIIGTEGNHHRAVDTARNRRGRQNSHTAKTEAEIRLPCCRDGPGQSQRQHGAENREGHTNEHGLACGEPSTNKMGEKHGVQNNIARPKATARRACRDAPVFACNCWRDEPLERIRPRMRSLRSNIMCREASSRNNRTHVDNRGDAGKRPMGSKIARATIVVTTAGREAFGRSARRRSSTRLC